VCGDADPEYLIVEAKRLAAVGDAGANGILPGTRGQGRPYLGEAGLAGDGDDLTERLRAGKVVPPPSLLL
jgi:hypothetical protein